MGVKSTMAITRDEAERRVTESMARRILWLKSMSDGELCELLTDLNDEDKGGEGFENYRITEDEE